MTGDRPIYLDFQATTPVDERVLAAMMPYFTTKFGNPASKTHVYGNEAHAAVEESRASIANAIDAKAQEIIFTSGATEAVNLCIKGVALNPPEGRRHFVTLATEHKAVLDTFEWLRSAGFRTTILPVNRDGLVDLALLERELGRDTALVAIMAANNEIGVTQPLEEIGKICRAAGALFFTDATQALGKIELKVTRQQIDLLAGSAHKVYGPKGVGFCYVRRSNPRVVLSPLIHGGGHEKGFRSGTLPTPLIVGFGEAVKVALKEQKTESKRLLQLRQKFLGILFDGVSSAALNGHSDQRLPGNVNVVLPGVDSEALIVALKDDISISSGSACTSAAVLPSHVLVALGLAEEDVRSSIRVGFGRQTTEPDVIHAANRIVEECARLRELRSWKA